LVGGTRQHHVADIGAGDHRQHGAEDGGVGADKASTGETGMPEIPIEGHDELSLLTALLNRMYISLQKALRLLGA
jgi:hypothetical protein